MQLMQWDSEQDKRHYFITITCNPFSVTCPFTFSTQVLAQHQWTLHSLFPHLTHQLVASSHVHISGFSLSLETGSYPLSEKSQEHHDY